MKHSLFTRLLSLVLTFALLVPCFPQVTAEEMSTEIIEMTEATEVTVPSEEAETTEATDPSEETEPTEATVPSEETEPTKATVPSEETEATDATDPSEETEPTEATDPSEETEPTEETEPEEPEPTELPYGFLGMPEDYSASERGSKIKEDMKAHQVLETMSGLIPGENYVENQILATAETEEEAQLIAQAYCGTLERYDHGIALITLSDATALEAVAASMDESLNLPAAVPNYTFKLEPMYSNPVSTFSALAPTEQTWNTWIHENMTDPDPALEQPSDATYQYMHDVIDSYAAWGVSLGGHGAISVGIIDTGVDADHPDLDTVWEIDAGCGYGDIVGHGTHVAGIIAATIDNGIGGAGVVPEAVIYSYRCADAAGSINDAAMIAAIYASADNGDDVINMSLGGYYYNPLVQEAINYATDMGATVVAAMGNDGSNTVCYPAACDNVIAVAATDRSNCRAWYSNYGAWADISAPGTDIWSTVPDDDWAFMSGTSMAAPVVTGAIALYMSVKGRTDPAQMEKILESSAVKCGDSGTGAGIVNIANMLDSKPDAPTFYIITEDDNYIYPEDLDGQAIPCESTLYLFNTDLDWEFFTLYTINGKTPSVKNGQVVNGEVYDLNGPGIDLSQYAGSTITLRAMQVSGMGVPGKVMTKKIKVADSINVTGVTVTGPEVIVAGKSGQFTATVLPADKADQSVEWSIVTSLGTNLSNVKISSKGILTTPKNADGIIGIRATSSVSGHQSEIFYVEIQQIDPVYKMKLSQATGTVYVGDTLPLSIASMTAKDGSAIDPTISGVSWTSSNKKVATVDANGTVTAVGKGKAVITCKTLDGSNKSAKCTVTVKQQVTAITISGNTDIHPGGTATLKATVSPSTANTKTVTWTLDSAPAGVTISASGKLKIPSYVTSGTVTVRATAKDGQGATATRTLDIQAKITGLRLEMRSSYSGLANGPTYNSKNVLTKVELFSVDLTESSAQDNYCALEAFSTGPSVGVTWTSSNPAVVSISGNGDITAHKTGSAKITCKALDGSNKKATVTIKVTNPVSYMEIKTNAPQMSNYTPYIGIGKSVTNKIVFGDTYGVPANKKVQWEFDVHEIDYDGNVVYDWTSYMSSNKLVTVSSSGKVTVNKKVNTVWTKYRGETDGIYNELVLHLYAISTDGTDTMASKTFYLIPPATQLAMYSNYKTVYADANDGGGAIFYSNQWHLFENFYESGFIATSSNPKVASVIGISPYEDNYYVYGNDYVCWFATGQKGTAKITIKATDGSGKSAVFTVKVR